MKRTEFAKTSYVTASSLMLLKRNNNDSNDENILFFQIPFCISTAIE